MWLRERGREGVAVPPLVVIFVNYVQDPISNFGVVLGAGSLSISKWKVGSGPESKWKEKRGNPDPHHNVSDPHNWLTVVRVGTPILITTQITPGRPCYYSRRPMPSLWLLPNDMYWLDDGVVGSGMGPFLIMDGPLAKDSAAKLKRSQLNVCTVYCILFSTLLLKSMQGGG
jgi:hypothetical protein